MQSVLRRRRASSSSGRAAAESIAEARVGGGRQRAARQRRQDLLVSSVEEEAEEQSSPRVSVWRSMRLGGSVCGCGCELSAQQLRGEESLLWRSISLLFLSISISSCCSARQLPPEQLSAQVGGKTRGSGSQSASYDYS
jgi:hypothetical protein